MPRLLAIPVVLLAAALCALAALPATASARPGVVIGVDHFGHMEDPAFMNQILDGERDVGAKVHRYMLRWGWVAKCDPRTRGNPTSYANPCYDWAFVDRIVRGAHARGMTVLFSIYGTPQWMFNGPENYTGTSEAEYARFVQGYAEFTQATATRYDGRHGQPRVDQWTVWNEPNGSFMEPRWVAGQLVGPARYARLYDAAARRIKLADPTLRVAVGPTAPHSPSLPPMKWTAEVLPHLQALGSPIDAWAHNGYTGKQSPYRGYAIKPPYVGLGNVNDLIALYDRYPVAAGKPLWITEFGYQTGGGQKAIEPHQQPALLADALRYAWEHPRIETFVWYLLFDDTEESPNNFLTGLYFGFRSCNGKVTGCAKPGAAMFRSTVWASAPMRDGSVMVWGQGRTQPALTRVYTRVPGGQWTPHVNADTARTGTVNVRLKLPVGTEVAACDTRCGPPLVVSLNGPVSPDAPNTGGGGGEDTPRVRIQRLPAVTLAKGPTLRYGLEYGVPCGGCHVAARMLAPQRVARSASRRLAIVGRSRVRGTRADRQVTAVFTWSARRTYARRSSATVILRTWIKYDDGRRAVYDRPVVLR